MVCHGGSDQFVSEKDVKVFRHQLDSIGADYKFIAYPDATHAFTNPDVTKLGKQSIMPISYNQKADMDSSNDMKMFSDKIL